MTYLVDLAAKHITLVVWRVVFLLYFKNAYKEKKSVFYYKYFIISVNGVEIKTSGAKHCLTDRCEEKIDL